MPSAAAEGGASRKDAECCKLSMQPRAGEASCRLGSERRLRVYWLNSPVSAAERAAAKACRGEKRGAPPKPQYFTTFDPHAPQLSLPILLCRPPLLPETSLPLPGLKCFFFFLVGKGKIKKPMVTSDHLGEQTCYRPSEVTLRGIRQDGTFKERSTF